MSDQKTIVISVRLTPAVHAALTARAGVDRQLVTRMAALLVEAGLNAGPMAPLEQPAGVVTDQGVVPYPVGGWREAHLQSERDKAFLRAEIEALQAGLARLRRELASRPAREIDPTRHHPAGPVLASAVPSVSGEATGFAPKASWSPKKEKRGKR